MKIKIENSNSLIRDTETMAVINTNKAPYEAMQKRIKKEEQLESRLSSLESKLEAILQILSKEK